MNISQPTKRLSISKMRHHIGDHTDLRQAIQFDNLQIKSGPNSLAEDLDLDLRLAILQKQQNKSSGISFGKDKNPLMGWKSAVIRRGCFQVFDLLFFQIFNKIFELYLDQQGFEEANCSQHSLFPSSDSSIINEKYIFIMHCLR